MVFYLLGRTFEYPDILRKPTGYILERFQEGGGRLVATWYAFMLAGVLFIPLGILLPVILSPGASLYIIVATVIAVLAGLVQVLGLIRWPFLVPYLARTYNDPEASQGTRDAVTVVFQAFHRYAGVAIGEHLGYLLTSLWTVFIAAGVIRSPLFSPWLGWARFDPGCRDIHRRIRRERIQVCRSDQRHQLYPLVAVAGPFGHPPACEGALRRKGEDTAG